MFRAACIDIPETRFWVLTAAELYIAARAKEHLLMTQAWRAERLRREKTLRPLSSYLSAPPQRSVSKTDLVRRKQEHDRLLKEMG